MNHDLLVFQHREPHAIPTGSPRPRKETVHLPSVDDQGEHIGPKLQRLTSVIENHRAVMQREIQGLEPESVIVFEVVGSVESFASAVRKAGMEWLGDWDEIGDADERFFYVDDANKNLTEKYYFTMTDHAALRQMLGLWERYQRGERQFPNGLTGFRDVFDRLKDVRLWNANDRFLETGVADVWRTLLQSNTEKICFEIELWYRDNERKRQEAQSAISDIIGRYGGRIVKSSVYTEISYHGLLAECPAEGIQQMMDNQDNDLFNANQVMWIRPTGQTIARYEVSDAVEENYDNAPLPAREPLVALFDGLPLAGHTLLHNRIDIHDVEGYEDDYQAQERLHGTEMASIILHGDLNSRLRPLNSMLYVRPVMKPNRRSDGIVEEVIPNDKLFVDVLHQSVLEIVNNPVFRSIKIINLSIGDERRPFSYVMSPTAKMLDYLSEKYGILFVVSTGNAPYLLDLPMTIGEYKSKSGTDKYKAIYNYLWQQQADTRLLSPAESMNAITVGSLSIDNAPAIPVGDDVDVVPTGSVAPYSRFGGGYGKAIKPDVVNVGGRMFYSLLGTSNSDARFRPKIRPAINSGPGIKTAVPTNGLTGTAYSFGTSHATAMTTRMCADLHDVLLATPNLNIPVEYEAVALKAMLVHSCTWGQMGVDMKEQFLPLTGQSLRPGVAKWIGYGRPMVEVSSYCTDQRVTLIGYGSLHQNQQVELQFPLPPSLVAKVVDKRLTITLAWMTPIASDRKDYREAKLSFTSPVEMLVDKTTVEADSRSTHRGTIQHEVYEGRTASTYEQNGSLVIQVSCKKDKRLSTSVKFAIMATLEVPQASQLPIYQEVAIKLQEQIAVLQA